jgi:23S rRNA pseudouridine955/2504/2580 synthase
MQYTAGIDDGNRRLDRILRKAFPTLPLSAIHRLLRQGGVLVDGQRGAAPTRVRAGAVIELPYVTPTTVDTTAVAPTDTSRRGAPASQQSMPTLIVRAPGARTPGACAPSVLDILWEGAGLLILNKPEGLAVHGPASLEDAVRSYLKDKLPPSLSFRPGPLHRLDKPTSGAIVFSASLEGARNFSALLREGRIRKRYIAIVEGIVDGEAYWEDLLIRDREERKTQVSAGTPAQAAQKARTRVFPLAAAKTGGYTLLEAELYTGRTHQIRAQAAAHGHPLAGDRKYGGHFMASFLLHARTLEIPALPGVEGPLVIKAPLPERFQRAVASLFGDGVLVV